MQQYAACILGTVPKSLGMHSTFYFKTYISYFRDICFSIINDFFTFLYIFYIADINNDANLMHEVLKDEYNW